MFKTIVIETCIWLNVLHRTIHILCFYKYICSLLDLPINFKFFLWFLTTVFYVLANQTKNWLRSISPHKNKKNKNIIKNV
ncbi:hypothetical protein BLOT_002588 [Blomia tropicalis]|nr:hypothetical protein BLOT_002588 [Blomia tropicalis]